MPNDTTPVDETVLPALPHNLLELLGSCDPGGGDTLRAARAVRQDPGLSATFLRVAGAPGLVRLQGTEGLAGVLNGLGPGCVRDVAAMLAVRQFFSPFDGELGRWKGVFWRESIACAASAAALARVTGYPAQDEAWVAGLLHRVARFNFLERGGGDYLRLLEAQKPDAGLRAGERELFGRDSIEVSAHLIRNWASNSFFEDAIRYQAEPAEQVRDTPPLVKLVNFACTLGLRALPLDRLCQEGDLLYALTRSQVEEVLEEVAGQVARITDEVVPGNGNGPMQVDDERRRLGLARWVRELALLAQMQHRLDESTTPAEMLEALLQGVRLLFSPGRAICFLVTPGHERLEAAAVHGVAWELGRQLSLQLVRGGSLVAEALLGERLCTSFDQDDGAGGVVERQLTTLLSSEGFLCLPFTARSRPVGVLVLGVDRDEAERLSRDTRWLQLFTSGVAGGIERRQGQALEQEQQLRQERERNLLRARRTLHEVNNSLGIVNNYLHVLALRLGEGAGFEKQLEVLGEELERVGELVGELATEPDAENMPEGVVDLNALIQEQRDLFEVSHFRRLGIQAQLDLDPDTPSIISNRNRLKQILANLISNAVEAQPAGGTVVLATRGQVNLNGVSQVELRVADDGPGIPGVALEHIFESGHSSKGEGHAGLGLSIVRHLVTGLGGTISCSNRRDGGAEFVVQLPRKIP